MPGIQDPNDLPWDPNKEVFPRLTELPVIENVPADAAWVWGSDDQLGRLNLLTPSRTAKAASEIVSGQSFRVDLPLNVPAQPSWDREVFRHCIKVGDHLGTLTHDDTYALNTQSGTQWDGFRHFSLAKTGLFYNGATAADITGPNAGDRIGVGRWCGSGMAGRGVLLDYRAYAESKGLTYDTATTHAISYAELAACGRHQAGLDIRPARDGGDMRPGDFLFIRTGYVQDYRARTAAENKAIGLREWPTYAGVAQEPAVRAWLHDCYFAAVGGDAPAFEAWPSRAPYYLHEHLLALWGVPIGEMLDLEAVAAHAAQQRRWTFFFCSAPDNCPGGVGTHVNGTVIF